jgi:metal-responsive CopG/Arc/MetJ family transcriptional regulator
MSSAKVAITLDEDLLEKLDGFVAEKRFPSRSRAIQDAVREKLSRLSRERLARECAKLDPAAEQQMAEEAIQGDTAEWPEY